MAESNAPPVHQWLGGAPNPWPPIHSLGDGDTYVACYFLGALELARTRHDKPYLRLQLTDRNGTVEARIWDDAEQINARVSAGSFVGVRGQVQIYRGEHQLKIDEIATVSVARDELGLFLPCSVRDADEMDRELAAFVDSIKDRPLQRLLRRLLGPDTEIGRRFRRSPAAKRNHHAYAGGLIEHSLSVATVCDFLARHYGAAVDRDLLVAGALVHDIGKVRELATEISFPYTEEGKLLGHILLGLRIVEDEAREVPELPPDRLRLLLHLVASHQGRYEWQSPREPRTIEALLLHYADDVDAKTTQVVSMLSAVRAGWTGYDRSLARDFLRHEPPAPTYDAPPRETQTSDPSDPVDAVARGEVGEPEADGREGDAVRRPRQAEGRQAEGREAEGSGEPLPDERHPGPEHGRDPRDPRLSLFPD